MNHISRLRQLNRFQPFLNRFQLAAPSIFNSRYLALSTQKGKREATDLDIASKVRQFEDLLAATDKQCKKSATHLYDQASGVYDVAITRWGWSPPSTSAQLLHTYLLSKRSNDLSEAVQVLDCCCGTGMVAERIRDLCAPVEVSIDAVDRSQGMMSVADQKGLYRSLTECDLNDAPHLPASMADNTYDAVICSGAFSYMAKDKMVSILKAMRRVCKPNGLIIISHRSDYMKDDLQHFEQLENDNDWKRVLLTDGELYLPMNQNYNGTTTVQFYVAEVQK